MVPLLEPYAVAPLRKEKKKKKRLARRYFLETVSSAPPNFSSPVLSFPSSPWRPRPGHMRAREAFCAAECRRTGDHPALLLCRVASGCRGKGMYNVLVTMSVCRGRGGTLGLLLLGDDAARHKDSINMQASLVQEERGWASRLCGYVAWSTGRTRAGRAELMAGTDGSFWRRWRTWTGGKFAGDDRFQISIYRFLF